MSHELGDEVRYRRERVGNQVRDRGKEEEIK